MIDDAVARLEAAIRRAGEADPKRQEELTRLLAELKRELRGVDPARRGEIVSLDVGGLKASTESFEAAHPQLIAVVNELCALLASVGI